MKRLVTSLLLIPLLAFGMSRPRPPAPQPTNTSTLDLATGQLTTSDYSGQSQSAAGNSRIADTGASTVGGKFADKSDPTMELAWFDINRAAEDQPDVAIDLALANEHKSAVEGLKAITAGGNPTVAALNLATEGLKAVKDKIAAREREKAARGKADTSAFRATAYLQGPGAVTSVAVMAGTMGAAVANGNEKRATYQSSINEKQIDTSNTNDYAGVAAVLKTQLEMTKLELEIAKLKQAVTPAKPTPPVVKPPANADDEEEPSDPPSTSDPAARAKAWYPGAASGGGNDGKANETFLWKPVSDGDKKAAIHTPASLRIVNVTVNGDAHGFGSYGNGYRPLFRLGKAGSAYGANVVVVMNLHDGRKVTVTVPNGGKRFETHPKVSSAGPVDPPPTTSSLFILEPDRLTLRPDFANAVTKIDVVANITEVGPGELAPGYVVVPSGKVGPYTWGIPKPLSSYPKGALPNTWRIRLDPSKGIPADVTYHKSINQTFIREGATTTYPPTTRE